MKLEISDNHRIPSSPRSVTAVRISNDLPVPHSTKSFACRIENGEFPLADGSRLLFVKAGPLRKILRKLRVGDNALFPLEGEDPVLVRSRLFSASRLEGITILSRAEGKAGLRIWRIS